MICRKTGTKNITLLGWGNSISAELWKSQTYLRVKQTQMATSAEGAAKNNNNSWQAGKQKGLLWKEAGNLHHKTVFSNRTMLKLYACSFHMFECICVWRSEWFLKWGLHGGWCRSAARQQIYSHHFNSITNHRMTEGPGGQKKTKKMDKIGL